MNTVKVETIKGVVEFEKFFEQDPGYCCACGEPGAIDHNSQLCRPCWRVSILGAEFNSPTLRRRR